MQFAHEALAVKRTTTNVNKVSSLNHEVFYNSVERTSFETNRDSIFFVLSSTELSAQYHTNTPNNSIFMELSSDLTLTTDVQQSTFSAFL